MKRGLFTLVASALCSSLHAQVVQQTPDNTAYKYSIDNILFNNNVRVLADKAAHKANLFEEIGGTDRFLINTWGAGEVVTLNNQTVNNAKYQYNYDFQLHELYAKKGDSVIVVNADHVRWFSISDKDARHTFGKFPVIGSNNFEELLSADTAGGKLKLVKQRSATLHKYSGANAGTALTGTAPADEYQNEISYFLISPDGKAAKIKLNKNSFLAGLPVAYRSKASELLDKYRKLDERNLALLINDLNSN